MITLILIYLLGMLIADLLLRDVELTDSMRLAYTVLWPGAFLADLVLIFWDILRGRT